MWPVPSCVTLSRAGPRERPKDGTAGPGPSRAVTLPPSTLKSGRDSRVAARLNSVRAHIWPRVGLLKRYFDFRLNETGIGTCRLSVEPGNKKSV